MSPLKFIYRIHLHALIGHATTEILRLSVTITNKALHILIDGAAPTILYKIGLLNF